MNSPVSSYTPCAVGSGRYEVVAPMTTCAQCHTQNKTGRTYSATCGQGLSHACAHGAFLNDPGDCFCGGCGSLVTPLLSSDVMTTVVPSPPNTSVGITSQIVGDLPHAEQVTLATQRLTGEERKTVATNASVTVG